MQNKVVSVVIPFYNIENYIEKCLKYIVGQTYRNLEILCVDNNSQDNSIKIVEKYLNTDNRIKLIKNKENLWPGGARNVGIKSATGEYIYFIDGDDFIDDDYIEKLVEAMEKHKTDIVCNNKILKYYEDDKSKNSFIKRESNFILNKKFDFDEKIARTVMTSSCCKLYKTDFLRENNLYFPEKLRFEDFAFLHLLKTKVKTISFIYNSTYYYVQRKNSIIHKYKEKSDQLDSIYIIKYIYNFYKENNLLNKFTIPFAWVKKFFKRQNDKQKYFDLLRDELLAMKNDINRNIYNKKDLIFFDTVLMFKKYVFFRVIYGVRRIIKL